MLITFFFDLFLIQITFTTIESITYSCWTNSTCGCSLNAPILTKIIGGEEATMNSWGWAVSIRFRNNHICGGSLISSELVLTAAHCLVSKKTLSSLSVTAGSHYLSIINQQRSISEISIHQNFNTMTYINDIAIIRLSSPFDMNDRSLAVICLPPPILEYPQNDTIVIAIGWGVLSMIEKISSDTLQQVTLKTVPNTISTCLVLIHNENGQFCAGVQGGGKDTCQGDSGGPLMMYSNQQWYIVGITSYGNGCGLPFSPGVYTRVSIDNSLFVLIC
ncbi:unnamed protein product [Rotaria sp. Silwood1]|nr:unnamed protein product [Rotaria sp. Silwood1]CAF3629595.1 unnamed protein product [Rotaria sp. Silwood1]CAF3648082.1 unnamed protein product [Rotaria sp. Silwood1]CAF4713547.1 unnamed protein product [Rotaria sp. Silwood1]